jgi:hypothetical protein
MGCKNNSNGGGDYFKILVIYLKGETRKLQKNKKLQY